MSTPLSLEDFVTALSSYTGLRLPSDEGATLKGIDGFDSLAALETLMFLEDLGADVPLDLWQVMTNIGELYYHYVIRLEQYSNE